MLTYIRKSFSEETKSKMRISHLGKIHPEETKAKISIALKGRPHSSEHNRKVGEANKSALKKYYDNNPDAKIRNSLAVKKAWREHPEKFENSIAILYKYADLRRQGIVPSGAEGSKRTEEWKQKAVKWLRMGSGKINKLESDFLQFCNQFGFQYLYCGSGTDIVCLGGKFPDFNHEKEKRVIELFGDYWHKGENPQDREQLFGNMGYKCLVIWEHEFRKDSSNVLDKIRRFENDNLQTGTG